MMRTVLLSTVTVLLSACSLFPQSPEYECPLTDAQGAKCASVEDSYRAARNMTKGDAGKVQSVFDRRVQPGAANAPAVLSNQPSNMPEPTQNGLPVFQQPKVMRAWVAPYVDADGNLRSGEYVYFSTPGQWNYGTMKNPGAASGIFEPGKPSNLGFKPNIAADVKTKSAGSPPKPANQAAPAAAQQAAQAAQQGGVSTKPADTVGNVTQPYQRLAN